MIQTAILIIKPNNKLDMIYLDLADINMRRMIISDALAKGFQVIEDFTTI